MSQVHSKITFNQWCFAFYEQWFAAYDNLIMVMHAALHNMISGNMKNPLHWKLNMHFLENIYVQ